MIAKLRGIVDSIGEDWTVIDVGGVGYLVFCSGRTLSRLSAGDAVALEIETHVREDHIHLYGFFEMAERDWFRILTTVQGVGAKVALALLSVLGADELLQAIASGDKSAITKAPGVGPKLATRILNELKDKVDTIALGPSIGGTGAVTAPAAGGIAGGSSNLSDATSALVNLGYNPSEALGAVSRVAGELGDDADVGALIRGGLRELAPADLR